MSEKTKEPQQIVKNTSQAGSGNYGYNYASLADIVNQGFTIPQMRIRPVFTPDGTTYIGDYFEYYDEARQEWQLGSRVIEGELKGQNAQQARGSSETYARRYTVMMALGIAGQDDKNVENDGVQRKGQKPAQKQQNKDPRLDFDTIRETCNAIDDMGSLEDYYKEIMSLNPSEGAKPYINKIINEAKKRLSK